MRQGLNWPGTSYVAKDDLDPPSSTSQDALALEDTCSCDAGTKHTSEMLGKHPTPSAELDPLAQTTSHLASLVCSILVLLSEQALCVCIGMSVFSNCLHRNLTSSL